MSETGEITTLLAALKEGDTLAESRLMTLLYKELHGRALRYMQRERRDHTLQPTALVHETFLRLTRNNGLDLRTRAHFLATASIIMRRVLVDHARERAAAKRSGGKARVEMTDVLTAAHPRIDDMLLLDEALNQLAACDARQARVVELLFFGGLTEEEAAGVLGVSDRTVKRDWRNARAWLQAQLTRTAP